MNYTHLIRVELSKPNKDRNWILISKWKKELKKEAAIAKAQALQQSL